MARSAEELRLVEPIEPSSEAPESCVRRRGQAADVAQPACAALASSLQRKELRGACANPFQDEPSPTVIAAVKRFGLVGLIACALGTGMTRWWRSLRDRD